MGLLVSSLNLRPKNFLSYALDQLAGVTEKSLGGRAIIKIQQTPKN